MPAVIEAGIDTIGLPHVRGLRDVLFAEGMARACAGEGRDINLMLQIETPRALFELEDIARWSTAVTAVSVGSARPTIWRASARR
jgi:citrate lyase beta subunit